MWLEEENFLCSNYRTGRRLKQSTPTHIVFLKHVFRWHKVYLAQREKGYVWDDNEMCQVLFSYVMYGRANLASLGGEMDNILDQVTVTMWKKFLGNNAGSYGRDNDFDAYYASDLRVAMRKEVSGLVDMMMQVIETDDFIITGDSMAKVRKGLGVHERRKGLSDKHLDYLAQFADYDYPTEENEDLTQHYL